MKIVIASDHGGFKLKEEVKSLLPDEIIDLGTYNEESTDYPLYAFKLCNELLTNNYDFGIVICKTGIGMSIACNKVKGIRCAKIDNEIDAEYSKRHNNANVLAFSSSKMSEDVISLINIYKKNKFEGERHLRRLNEIMEYENGH